MKELILTKDEIDFLIEVLSETVKHSSILIKQGHVFKKEDLENVEIVTNIYNKLKEL